MRIKALKLKQFRNYDALELTLDPGVNLFFGPNGSGKTNLLEAVHYCALGRSHRTAQDREVIARDREMGACGVSIQRRDGVHDVAVKLLCAGEKRKQVFLDGKRIPRLAQMMGMLQCVIFSPEDLLLVKDGPAARRRFLDMLLSQLSTQYFLALQGYQQALRQRNALLRQFRQGPVPAAAFLPWEEAMARAAAVIIPQRRACCQRLSQEAQTRYQSISGREQERFALTYQGCLDPSAEIIPAVMARLEQLRGEDIRRGGTSFGPHREDLLLTIQQKDMRLFASQGQMRTAALAMKLSELSVFRQLSGEAPVLLLDDVMSELDLNRRTRLLDEIRGVQTLITCTDESDLNAQEKYVPWRVSTDATGCARVMACVHEEREQRLRALDDDFLQ